MLEPRARPSARTLALAILPTPLRKLPRGLCLGTYTK
jgi:hypothetical protein